MPGRKIIIDTDPGQDDAVAILLALASAELDVLGLTIVAGNVSLHYTVEAARKVVELAERTEVPIYAGCSRPISKPLVTAEHVHGATGIDGVDFADPTVPVQSEHAVDFIIRTLRAEPAGDVTLVTLGPLTNIGLALVKAPDIAPRVREIVAIMGSLHQGGNITPLGDFNTYVDPEAADLVLQSGIPIVMVPMDITHQVLNTRERLDAWRATGTRCGAAAADLMQFSEAFDLEKYGWGAAPLHDPCAIVYLLAPELFSGRTINVRVSTDGTVSTGMTVVDWWRVSGREPNCDYLLEVDVPALYDLMTERLALLP
ncbi:nucleoside hydrolase [Herbiconiux daphne]|uniref:Nucleoside hydrolase n=1 Tax=Herbiconiux daphne TaxID=2970914 RepID=A0ABT2H367_9MICO|nr:nucleoside hydrolase [Herbiconiux daphne]MCS5734360.1 nucleoside hydrolase [Herbiconiux daphne]